MWPIFRLLKPGHTAARNWDHNNVLVVNPETAARGIYTDFCGYFYQNNWTAFVA